MKLGDAVATFAQPIARGIDAAFGTDLQNCSGCGIRQARLNALGDGVIELFAQRLHLKTSNQTRPMAKFIVTRTKQVLVEADTPELAEAAEIAGQGETINMSRSVTPRPVQPSSAASSPQARGLAIPAGGVPSGTILVKPPV